MFKMHWFYVDTLTESSTNWNAEQTAACGELFFTKHQIKSYKFTVESGHQRLPTNTLAWHESQVMRGEFRLTHDLHFSI